MIFYSSVTFVRVDIGEKEVEFVGNAVPGDTIWKAFLLLGFQFWKGKEVGILHGGKVLQRFTCFRITLVEKPIYICEAYKTLSKKGFYM